MSFLDHLDESLRARLEGVAERVDLPEGSFLMRRGDPGGDIFRLEAGTLEVVDIQTRPVVILDVLTPGTVVGEMAFLSGAPRSADVRAGGDAVVSRWDHGNLSERLRGDSELASAFHRALALLLSKRLRDTTDVAAKASHTAGHHPLGADEELGAIRAVAERVKQLLRDAENHLRKGQPGGDLVLDAWTLLLAETARVFLDLEGKQRSDAGRLLSDELQPWLVRSKLADLSLARFGDQSASPLAVAHIELGKPSGTDALGALLDGVLLQSDTAVAIRARSTAISKACVEVLARAPTGCSVLQLHAGTGAVSATLLTRLASRDGRLTVVDGDRDALAHLHSGPALGPAPERLSLIHRELAPLLLAEGALDLGTHHMALLSGIAEFLPERVLASLLRRCRTALHTGGYLALDILTPSTDQLAFDHLLQWQTVRRTAQACVGLLREVGYGQLQVQEHGAMAVLIARKALADDETDEAR